MRQRKVLVVRGFGVGVVLGLGHLQDRGGHGENDEKITSASSCGGSDNSCGTGGDTSKSLSGKVRSF